MNRSRISSKRDLGVGVWDGYMGGMHRAHWHRRYAAANRTDADDIQGECYVGCKGAGNLNV